MRKFIFSFLSLLFTGAAIAQTPAKKNTIYLEGGGNGTFGSLNYERQLSAQPGLNARVGLGFYTEYGFYLTIPAGLNYVFQLKNEKSFLEAGAGLTWVRYDGRLANKTAYYRNLNFTAFVTSFGYRHQSDKIMWRANLCPIINRYGPVPWIGLSIGKPF